MKISEKTLNALSAFGQTMINIVFAWAAIDCFYNITAFLRRDMDLRERQQALKEKLTTDETGKKIIL